MAFKINVEEIDQNNRWASSHVQHLNHEITLDAMILCDWEQAIADRKKYDEMVQDIKSVLVCTCEHTNHFNDDFGPQTAHNYASVPAGTKKAKYVGEICDECANNCMKDDLIESKPQLTKEELRDGVDPLEMELFFYL